jgi:hypothetical protein
LKSSKKWWMVGGFAASVAAVMIVAGLVGGVLWGAIPASAQEPEPTWPCGEGGQLGFGWHLGGWGARAWTMFDTVAQALGLTPQEFFTELHDEGKTVTEIAEEKGIDIETVQDAVGAARGEAMREAIEQAVEDGKLTQEQADWLLEGLEQGFFPGGRGMGRGGHFGFRRGGFGPWGWFGEATPQEQ